MPWFSISYLDPSLNHDDTGPLDTVRYRACVPFMEGGAVQVYSDWVTRAHGPIPHGLRGGLAAAGGVTVGVYWSRTPLHALKAIGHAKPEGRGWARAGPGKTWFFSA